jgi:hypothetical protein
MGTAQVVFAEDPDDLTIAHAWPEVTGSDVTENARKCHHRKSRDLFPYFFVPYFLSPYFFQYFFFYTFFPYFFPRTLSRIFFLYFFPYFLFVLFFRTFFLFFFPFFFLVLFPVLFFPTFFYLTYFPVLFTPRTFFSRTFLFPYYLPVPFPMSRRLKSNVLKYQLVVFLEHVVITQVMFLAEYSFKRHPQGFPWTGGVRACAIWRAKMWIYLTQNRIEMFYSTNPSYHWKLNQSEVAIFGRLANQKPGKKNQSERRIQKETRNLLFFFIFIFHLILIFLSHFFSLHMFSKQQHKILYNSRRFHGIFLSRHIIFIIRVL